MRRRLALLLSILALAACTRAPAGPPASSGHRIRVGFSMSTLKEERWQRDRDLFVARARDLGADVIVQSANNDDYLQRAQAEAMLARGVDVLVIVPHDTAAMGPVVTRAHAQGVKVVAYDRLITSGDLDLYISFDNVQVGELQAEYLLVQVPHGRYVYIGGAPTDYNATLLREGAMRVLAPLVRSGAINIVYSAMTPDWDPEQAAKLMTEALRQAGGKVDAVIAANDGTAGGVVAALAAAGLAGKVPVSGQDADLAALRRIVTGRQTMTVYKPIHQLADRAASIAVALAGGAAPPSNSTISTAGHEVPAWLIPPVPVTAGNVDDTVVKDGFHRHDDIYG